MKRIAKIGFITTCLFLFFFLLGQAFGTRATPTTLLFNVIPSESATYSNLYASVQGETNASAAYKAFADKALEEGRPAIARLFLATSNAEAKHAADEWTILQSMGATERPVAATPEVGTTAENLQAAIEG